MWVVAVAACIAIAHAQSKTDLSGTWKLNLDQSDFGPLPKLTSRIDKIEHHGKDLKIATTQVGPQGEFSYEMKYVIDGSEVTNTVVGNPFKSKLKFEGDVLVIETQGSINGNDFTMVERYTLSADGKTLTDNRHLKGANGEADQKWILEKQ
jgi:hypothetical protein